MPNLTLDLDGLKQEISRLKTGSPQAQKDAAPIATSKPLTLDLDGLRGEISSLKSQIAMQTAAMPPAPQPNQPLTPDEQQAVSEWWNGETAKPQPQEVGQSGVAEALKDEFTGVNLARKVPFASGAIDIVQAEPVLTAISRLKDPEYNYDALNEMQRVWQPGPKGTFGALPRSLTGEKFEPATRERDLATVEAYLTELKNAEEKDYSFGGKVARGVSQLPTWMLEFAATGGLEKIGNTAVKKWLKSKLGDAAKKGAGKALTSGAGLAAGAAVRTSTGLLPRVAGGTAQNQLAAEIDPETNADWAKSFAKAWGDTFIESFSEKTGEGISAGMGALVSKTKLGSKFLDGIRKAWTKTTGGTADEFATKLAKAGGYSNIIGEIGEERVGTILRAITGVEDYGAGKDSTIAQRLVAGLQQDIQNLPVEAAVLAVPGAARKVPGAIQNITARPQAGATDRAPSTGEVRMQSAVDKVADPMTKKVFGKHGKIAADSTKSPTERLNSVNSMRLRMRHMQDTAGSQEVSAELDRIEAELKERGYEVVDFTGKELTEEESDGLNATIAIIDDPSLAEGKMVVKSMRRPQVNKDGKLTQAAKMTVRLGSRQLTPAEQQAKAEKERLAEAKRAKLKAELLGENTGTAKEASALAPAQPPRTEVAGVGKTSQSNKQTPVTAKLTENQPSESRRQSNKIDTDQPETVRAGTDESAVRADLIKEAGAILKAGGAGELKKSLLKSELDRFKKGEGSPDKLRTRIDRMKAEAESLRAERLDDQQQREESFARLVQIYKDKYTTPARLKAALARKEKEIDKFRNTARSWGGTSDNMNVLQDEKRALQEAIENPPTPLQTASANVETESTDNTRGGRAPVGGIPSETLPKPPQQGGRSSAMGDPAVGAPNEIDRGRIKTSLKPGGKPISARQILDYASKAFNVPIRGKATHNKPMALGWYNPKETGIRMKDVRSLTTGMHEIGHHIDRTLGKKTSAKTPPEVAKELMRLGKDLYGSRRPSGGYKSEGWAEYIRIRLTEDNPAQKAPALHQWFENVYLKDNPQMRKKLDRIRGMVDKWRMQGADARIESQINRKPIKGSIMERIENASLWADVMFRDELSPLRRAVKATGKQLRPSKDPYQIAVARADKAGSVARQFVLHYTTDLAGERNGKGLRDILKPVKDIKGFTKYMVARRALDLHDRGVNPGISHQDAQYVVDKYDNPEWSNALRDVTDWNRRILGYLVEAGGLTRDAAKRMEDLNPIYVPFMRAFRKGEVRRSGGTGKGMTNTAKGVKSIKGSGREIIDPLESMIQQAERIISLAHKSEVSIALADMSQLPGMAKHIWRVPAPKQAIKVQADQLKKDVARLAVERMGIDPEDIPDSALLDEWDEMLTVFTNAGRYTGKDNIVSIVRDGDLEFYELSPELYETVQALDQYSLPWFLDVVFGKANRAVRLGATGLNPAFGLIRNPIRDAAVFSVQAQHAKLGPVSAAQGVAEDMLQTQDAQKFIALGGKMSSQIMHDRTATQHLRGEMLARTLGGKTVYHTTHPVNAIRELLGVTEAGTRIGEFKAALKKGEKLYGKGSKDAAIYALNAAQDVTTNFTRHGKIGKVLNQMTPFFNAAVQGPDKMLRTFKARPTATMLKAIAYLTVPAILLWRFNKDKDWYRNMPSYEKNNYLHFEVPGKDVIVRMPVPFELGYIFQSLPVSMLDQMYNDDPDAVRDMFSESVKNSNPMDWPAALGPLVDVAANKDFADRPIVPKRLQYKLPEDQYTQYTSEFAKVLGRTLKYSPEKIEHLLNSYSGGLFQRGKNAISPRDRERTLSDIPVAGTLFMREPYAPKAQINDFYETRDILNRLKQSDKITARQNRARLSYNRIGRKLSPLWKALRKTKTESQRKKIYNRMETLIKRADYPELTKND